VGDAVKRFLTGCLIVLVLAGILFAVSGYILYRAASPVIENARNYLSGLTELGELAKQVKNQAPYSPPASGELSDAQVQRFARVQDAVRSTLGQRMKQIEEKYKQLQADAKANQQPSFGDILSALGDMANIVVQARRYQVDALNQEGFSQAEYSWVRDKVFQAAGQEVVNLIDLKKVEDAVRQGTGIEGVKAPPLPKIDVPPKNRELVKPYLDRMDSWIPLAFFGF
jgi:hypothetical protein